MPTYGRALVSERSLKISLVFPVVDFFVRSTPDVVLFFFINGLF